MIWEADVTVSYKERIVNGRILFMEGIPKTTIEIPTQINGIPILYQCSTSMLAAMVTYVRNTLVSEKYDLHHLT